MWNKFKGLNKGLGGLKDIAKKIRTTEEEIEEKAALTEATGLLPKKHADFDMFKEQMLPKMATGGSLKAVRARHPHARGYTPCAKAPLLVSDVFFVRSRMPQRPSAEWTKTATACCRRKSSGRRRG